MTATPPSTREHLYTAAELLDISTDSSHRYELRQGKLLVMPLAGFEHGCLTAALGARIHVHAAENQLGPTFAAGTGFLLTHNPDTVLAPDIAFVSRERISTTGVPQGYFSGTPDLAVEIIEPDDGASDVLEKVQDWLHHRTKLVWIVEPKTKTVTVYRADGSVTLLQASDILDSENVLPGFRYDLKRLFA